MRHQLLAVGSILLLCGITLFPIHSTGEENVNRTIYVDDDNTEGPWDGTREHPYQLIQDGINNASDGDTVFVHSGIYDEKIIVDKSITLLGEDKNNTIIDGQGNKWIYDYMCITADNVNVSGFLFQYCGTNYQGGIGVYSNFNSIKDNIIVNSTLNAIVLENGSTGNSIKDNYIAFNDGIGIFLDHCSYNCITNNILENNVYSNIHIFSSSHNVVERNFVGGGGRGISLVVNSEHNVIYGNKLNDTYNGISLLFLSNNNSISGNYITRCILEGIWIEESSSNLIDNNTLSRCEDGIISQISSNNIFKFNIVNYTEDFSFALAFGSQYNTVTGNAIVNNKRIGIILHKASNNIIIENDITENQEDGIFLEQQSNTNIISKNLIERNNGYGLYLDNSSDNEITCNNLMLNKRTAVFTNSQNIWDGNYWNRPRFLPKLIYGTDVFNGYTIPWVNFDWHPAWKPYDIRGG